MDLTSRQVRLLGVASFLLLVVGTPLAAVYAMDYRLTETQQSLSGDPPVVPYEELGPKQKAAIDGVLSGDSPWYRTRADMPFNQLPMYVIKDDRARAIAPATGYNFEAWYGKIPLGTVLLGLAGIGYTVREAFRGHGAVPVR